MDNPHKALPPDMIQLAKNCQTKKHDLLAAEHPTTQNRFMFVDFLSVAVLIRISSIKKSHHPWPDTGCGWCDLYL
jgi:hypothetical protein